MPKKTHFLFVNEAKLRLYFDQMYQSIHATPEIQYVAQQFETGEEMRELAKNPKFRQSVVASLFPKVLIELLGGTEELLGIPSRQFGEPYNRLVGFGEPDNRPPRRCKVTFSNTRLSYMDLMITMDRGMRPVLALRMKQIRESKDFNKGCTVSSFTLTFHACEAHRALRCWVLGGSDGLQFPARTDFKLSRFFMFPKEINGMVDPSNDEEREDWKRSPYNLLRSLLQGKSVAAQALVPRYQNADYGSFCARAQDDLVRRNAAATKTQDDLARRNAATKIQDDLVRRNAAATKIQAMVRAHPIATAYKSLLSKRNQVHALLAEMEQPVAKLGVNRMTVTG